MSALPKTYPDGVKRCTKCGESKPLSEFWHRKRRGHNRPIPACKVCDGANARNWSNNNKDRVRSTERAWRDRNKERLALREKLRVRDYKSVSYRKYRRQYVEEHKREVSRGHHSWYLRNKEKVKGQATRWHRAHPHKRAEIEASRRAKIRNADPHDRALMSKFYAHARTARRISCYWCNKRIPMGKRQIDHIHALSGDGLHTIHNLCVSCPSCNWSKHDRPANEFSTQLILL